MKFVIFSNVYSQLILRWTCHVARMDEDRSSFTILTSRPTGNYRKLLRNPRRKWEDNIE